MEFKNLICEDCKEEEGIAKIKNKWICVNCWNKVKQTKTERRLKTKMTKEKTKNKSNTMSSIVCSVCKEKKGVRPEIYKQRIKKFGSEEKLLKEYVCRDCRKKNK